MKKVLVKVSTRFVGSEDKRIIEVDDKALEKDIEEIAQETMWEMIDFSWEEVK